MNQKKFNKGWLTIIGLMFISLTSWQLTGSIASVFALPVTAAWGISKASFMMWMTIQSLVALVAGPAWGWLISNKKISIKILMLIGVLANGCACFIFAAADGVIYLYIAAVLVGFAQPGINNVAIAYLTSQWVSTRIRGTLLSVVQCCGGVGGFFFPIIVNSVIAGSGWQTAYVVCGVIILVCCVPWTFFMARSPEDVGMKQIGWKPEDEENEEKKADASLQKGMPASMIFRSWPFWTLLVAAVILACFGGYKSNISGFAEEFLAVTVYAGETAAIAAFCLSMNSVMDLIGNFTLGPLIDRFGLTGPVILWLVIAVLCPVFWIFLGDTPYGLYAGAFCFGIHGSILKVAVPLIMRKLFGPKNFGKAYGFMAAAKNGISGFAATVIALFFDLTGSYIGALYCGLGIIAIVAILLFITIKAIGKYDWENTDYGEEAVAA